MRNEYFATRTLARNFVSANGGKVQDNGKDAEAGKRWSVAVEEVAPVAVVATAPAIGHEINIDKMKEIEANFSDALKRMDVISTSHTTKKISFLQNVNQLENKLKNQLKEVISKITGGIIGEQVLTTPNNKNVRVMYRRSMVPVRLAQSIAKSS